MSSVRSILRATYGRALSGQSYRREIDGLLAVAVGSVVAFHACPSSWPGGFVGVDIFFVISGFLITRIVLDETERGEFSLASFYERRLRRLLPALVVVLVATLGVGALLLPPFDLSDLGRDVPAVMAFVSNIRFWFTSGYFEAAAHARPLLHTWSLGVEEQFYLFWPLLLVFACRSRRALAIIAAVGIASLAVGEYQVRRWPDAAFYLLPARIAEFACGSLIAALPPSLRRLDRVKWMAGLLGVGLLAAALAMVRPETRFPGLSALLPCAGAALIIWAGPVGLVGRVLAWRPLVAVGLISYSLYLWHWPVLLFAEDWVGRDLMPTETATALALIVALAVLTWRYVELPFRSAGPETAALRQRTFIAAGLAVLLLAATGSIIHATKGLGWRASPFVLAKEEALSEALFRRAGCDSAEVVENPDRCKFGAGPLQVAVWGDSHAGHLMPAVLGRAAGFSFLDASTSGCPPLLGVDLVFRDVEDDRCEQANAEISTFLERDASIRTVILSARWSLYAETFRSPAEREDRSFLTDDVSGERSIANSRRALEAGLDRTVRAMLDRGLKVIIAGQVPENRIDPAKCLVRAWWTDRRPECAQPRKEARRRMEIANAIIGRIVERYPQVVFFDPMPRLCDDVFCRTVSDRGFALYRDADHLTVEGARLLAPFVPLPNGVAAVSPMTRCDVCGRFDDFAVS